jgi:hypothetical protein
MAFNPFIRRIEGMKNNGDRYHSKKRADYFPRKAGRVEGKIYSSIKK